jgi:hypothetical protein
MSAPGNWQETVNELAAAQAEIERLREALEYISKHSFSAAYGCDHIICYECLHTHEKARQALAGKETP